MSSDGEAVFAFVMGVIFATFFSSMIWLMSTEHNVEKGQCIAISGEYDMSQDKCVVDNKLVDLPGGEEDNS